MTQHELYQEVARVTGESVATISGMGFSVVAMPPPWAMDHRPRRGGFGRRLRHRRRKAHGWRGRQVHTKTAPAMIPALAPAA